MLIFVALSSAPASNESAEQFNKKGANLYKRKRYPEALDNFYLAIDADPQYAPGHYNLARTLAIFRKKGLVCDYDAYQGAILEHLDIAIELDSSFKARALRDPAFVIIHGTYRYQMLLGMSPTKTEDVRTMFTRITWYGPSPGAYGPVSGMTFSKKGRMELLYIDFDDPEQVDRVEIQGGYSVSGNEVTIELDKPLPEGDIILLGILLTDGKLDFGIIIGPFTDDPDECSG